LLQSQILYMVEKLNGKYLLRTSDKSLPAKEISLGYKQFPWKLNGVIKAPMDTFIPLGAFFFGVIR